MKMASFIFALVAVVMWIAAFAQPNWAAGIWATIFTFFAIDCFTFELSYRRELRKQKQELAALRDKT